MTDQETNQGSAPREPDYRLSCAHCGSEDIQNYDAAAGRGSCKKCGDTVRVDQVPVTAAEAEPDASDPDVTITMPRSLWRYALLAMELGAGSPDEETDDGMATALSIISEAVDGDHEERAEAAIAAHVDAQDRADATVPSDPLLGARMDSADLGETAGEGEY